MASYQATIRNPRHTTPKAIVALLLTFTAGFVDIVGLLTIYQLFTAHMTGTTVHLGEQLIRRNWPAAVVAASIVAAFLVGSVIGRIIIEAGSRATFRRVASVTLLLEWILLISVTWWGSDALRDGLLSEGILAVVCPLVSMLAFAMGLQTATLTRIGPLTIHTTFVTGMLNKLAQLTSRWMFLTHDLHFHSSSRDVERRRQRSVIAREARFVLAIWCLYFAGAVCGTWFALHWQLRSLLLPCLLLFFVILVDQARPLSLEEEQEQP